MQCKTYRPPVRLSITLPSKLHKDRLKGLRSLTVVALVRVSAVVHSVAWALKPGSHHKLIIFLRWELVRAGYKFRIRKRVNARPLLQSLHWLPIQERIRYKVALITYKALSTSVPSYLNELLQCQETTRSLRSTDAPRLFVPRTRTETAKRAFSVAAPNVWNSLPIDIRNTDCLSSFRNKLKTHFFTASYT